MTVAVSTPSTRDAIVDAALAILQDEGPAALTVRRITDAAGCSTTGIYTHFGGKAGVIEAIHLDGFASFDAALAAAYDHPEGLLESGRTYRRWALDHPTQYMVMFGRAVPDYVPSERAAARASVAFERLVGAIAAAGDFERSDAVAWAYHVFATVHGYVMLEISTAVAPVADLEARYERMLTQLLFTSMEDDGNRPPRIRPSAPPLAAHRTDC